MKFCVVMPFHISEQRGGGAEVQAWILAKELARRGHDVYYISQTVKSLQLKNEDMNGVEIVWIKQRMPFEWQNSIYYYNALKEVDPDIVIQRMTSFITGVIGLYCKWHKKKFVWICTDDHSSLKWHFIKKQFRANKDFKPNLLKRSILLLNALISEISRNFGMRFITLAFTQNELQKNNLYESFQIISRKYYSGHELSRNIIPHRSKLKKPVVLWVANLGKHKRPELFIELANLAQKSDCQFVMIGNKLGRTYVDALFRSKPNSLMWLGRLPFEETLTWFDRALIFINTSTIEGFPNTFIQSWIRGVPIITLGVDPDNVIEKYRLGFVEKNLDDLLNRINYLRGHVKEYVEISENCRLYARENHSIKKSCDVFLNTVSE